MGDIGEQGLASALGRRLDQVERRGTVDQVANDGEEKERQGVGAVAVPGKREVAEHIVGEQGERVGSRGLGRGRQVEAQVRATEQSAVWVEAARGHHGAVAADDGHRGEPDQSGNAPCGECDHVASDVLGHASRLEVVVDLTDPVGGAQQQAGEPGGVEGLDSLPFVADHDAHQGRAVSEDAVAKAGAAEDTPALGDEVAGLAATDDDLG